MLDVLHDGVAKLFAALVGHQRGKMVDGYGLQGKRLLGDADGGVLEVGQLLVDGKDGVRVGGVTADINEGRQLPPVCAVLYHFHGEEGSKLEARSQINTIEQDVVVQKLAEGTSSLRLGYIPLCHGHIDANARGKKRKKKRK